MKITVAIPCYNQENRIARCLESILTQDYQDFEVLVIDDHSTDKSVSIVEDTLAKYAAIPSRHIINETNLGLNIVRNIAIREASGDCLFFVDADDTIESGTLTLFHQKMEETGAEVVCGSFRKTDFKGNTILEKRYPAYRYEGVFAISTYIENHLTPQFGLFPISVWNKLYRLSFLRQHHIRCIDSHRYCEDNYFSLQVALNAKSVVFIDTITYNYIQSSSSICNQKADHIKCDSIYAVMTSLFQEYGKLRSSNNVKPIPKGLMYLINMMCLTGGMLNIFYSSALSKKEKKDFLKWVKKQFRQHNIRRKDIVGIYNIITFTILVSPCPYYLFHFYFKHIKTVVRVVNFLPAIMH